MTQRTALWLHETKRLTLLYFLSALCFLPGGIVYTFLSRKGTVSTWAAASILVASLAAALLVWNAAEKRTDVRIVPISDRPAGVASVQFPGTGQVALVTGAYICFFLVYGGQRVSTVQVHGKLSPNIASNFSVVSVAAQ